ncbi:WD40 repeat domain-containing protein [Streptomyces sp. NPDC048636]|uniref:WD40 repeat domain-containing protein n=1 Tax=Streptomyces sp. NPDC048636 TaxID=3155762 RepID=UPI0034304D91
MTGDVAMTGLGGHDHSPRAGDRPVLEWDGVPVVFSVDTEANLWICDLRGGPCVRRELDRADFGPDDDIEVWDLFDGGDEGDVLRVWDLATKRLIGEPMGGHTDMITRLKTTVVDGRAVAATDSMDGTTRLWDLARGTEIGDPLIGQNLNSIARIAGRQVVITTSAGPSSREGEGRLRVWDLARAIR